MNFLNTTWRSSVADRSRWSSGGTLRLFVSGAGVALGEGGTDCASRLNSSCMLGLLDVELNELFLLSISDDAESTRLGIAGRPELSMSVSTEESSESDSVAIPAPDRTRESVRDFRRATDRIRRFFCASVRQFCRGMISQTISL
ncbi:hypothetical protein OGAPHI_001396 [Ogataea philodendri]|uniref:Uncharacterized protein n=1 Tax=Ogataea philodendri TaxID=1378263 RepID=A0A9P8T8J6_9ASCO|nr:uncharacterized protein OGAPHI_001396 [Ogataea philodendri]KAH3669275.1 hypothetical protein OGAPHI_001396 [Ogataea philodendri]